VFSFNNNIDFMACWPQGKLNMSNIKYFTCTIAIQYDRSVTVLNVNLHRKQAVILHIDSSRGN